MTRGPQICCVEGHWGEEGRKGEDATIRPMLKMLRQWDYWPFEHKKCRTLDEARSFLESEWPGSAAGSVLFFATHGCPGEINLSDEQSISLGDLGRWECLAGARPAGLVHFSGCSVVRCEKEVRAFLEGSGAAAVSGYRADVGWAEAETPAVLSDLMLLNALWENRTKNFRPPSKSHKDYLRNIEGDVQRRFGDCQFEIAFPDDA